MPAVKTPVGANAKTHRFDWRPRETLRPPVTHTYMMLSKFRHGRRDKAILGVGCFVSRDLLAVRRTVINRTPIFPFFVVVVEINYLLQK